MKIAFLCPGGIIRSIKWYERNLASRLVRLGFKVRAYTSKEVLAFFPQEKETDIIDGIEVIRYDGWISIKPRIKVSGMGKLLYNISKFRPNLIHIHFPSYMNSNAWIALYMKYVYGTPFIITIHNILLDPYIKANYPHTYNTQYDVSEIILSSKELLLKTLKSRVIIPKDKDIVNYLSHAEILHADKVVALTSFEKRILVQYLKVPEEKIVIIPNAINEDIIKYSIPKAKAREKLRLPKDKYIILFLAQMIELKGPQFLIESLQEVFNKIPNAIAIFAGYNTQLAPYIIKRAKELNIKDRVYVHAQHLEEEKYLYYSACDVYVLPTLTEGFPTSILEAMAFGKPVIVSDVTGVNDVIVNGINGFLVKPGSINELSEIVVKVLLDRNLASRVGKNAQTIVKQRYTWGTVVKNYIKLYFNVLRRGFR